MRRSFYLLLSLAVLSAACTRVEFPMEPGNESFPGNNPSVNQLQEVELSWSATSFEATLGGENSFPTLSNPHGVAVQYASSDADVATVASNGAVTLSGEGTTLISASFEGNDTYSAASVSYALVVIAPAESGDDDESLSFDSTGDPSSDDDISKTTFVGKITITYSKTADASVKGDSYGYVSVNGNQVTVNNTGGECLIYELKGISDNAFFKVYGSKKQAIVLNGVSLTNPDGAAINNQCKKRTFVVLKGSNTLSDGPSAAYEKEGEEDMKAVFFSEAQLIFSGSGVLSVHALNNQGKAGITSDDYIRLMDSPTLEVQAGSGAGNGVRGKDYVQLSSGSLLVSISAAMKKGISSDDYVLVEGGTHMVTSDGGVAYDEEDEEYTGTACIKADNYFGMTGGTLTLTNTGDGGKGIRAGVYGFDETEHTLSDSYFSGGLLTVTVSGRETNDVSSKGIKIGYKEELSSRQYAYAGNFIVSGGKMVVSSAKGEGLEVKGNLTFDGGETYVSSTGDDAINSQGELNVNDGFVYAFSSANDAMDSNADTKLNGGFVYAICTRGNPEVALDANTEEGYRLYINSGVTLAAYGGLERGYSAAQTVYSMSATAGAWNGLYNGTSFIAAFKAPSNISKFIVSAPSLSSGYKGVSVSGEPLCNGVWAVSGITGGSSVSLSKYNGNSGGGPGGQW